MLNLRYFVFSLAVILISFTQQSNGVRPCGEPVDYAKTTQSQLALHYIEVIINDFKENEKYGGNFADAKVIVRNGFINSLIALSTVENRIIDGYNIAEKQLNQHNSEAALQAIEKANVDNEVSIISGGRYIFQALGEALALCNGGTRSSFSGTNVVLQKNGLEVIRQLTVLSVSASRGIRLRGELAVSTINAARQNALALFSSGYELLRISHLQTLKDISNIGVGIGGGVLLGGQVIRKLNADDPEAIAAVSEIEKLAIDAIHKGASAKRVDILKEAFISSLASLSQVTSDARRSFANVEVLSDKNPAAAEAELLRGLKEVFERIQLEVSEMFLNIAPAGLNLDCTSREQIGLAIRNIEHGKVDVTFGDRMVVDLTILGLQLPPKIRSGVFSAALVNARVSKTAWYRRIIEAARVSFDVMYDTYFVAKLA